MRALITRRGFLKTLGAVVGAAVVAPKIAATPAYPHINGAGQTGNTLATSGWSVGETLQRGDVFTIEGVYSVNPVTGRPCGFKQFVVTADVTEDGTIQCAPQIIAAGPYRNVSAPPKHRARVMTFALM